MAPGLVPARLGVLGILVAFLPWPSLEAAPLEVAFGQVIDARLIIERWRQAYNRLRVDAFVDVPAANIFRLYRQRADGTLTVNAFSLPGRLGDPAYGEMARRVEEATIRQTGRLDSDDLGKRGATLNQPGEEG